METWEGTGNTQVSGSVGRIVLVHLDSCALQRALARSSRTSPVLTGPETSVSCNRSPSGGGYLQLRLLVHHLYSRLPLHRERWQYHLHRTSPVLTGPETSVSCNRSPSGGGYLQLRLLVHHLYTRLPLHRERWQYHLHRTSPVLTEPETSVSCNRSP